MFFLGAILLALTASCLYFSLDRSMFTRWILQSPICLSFRFMTLFLIKEEFFDEKDELLQMDE